MFGMWFLRVWADGSQWLCCYSGGETKAKEGPTADSGVVFRTVGCEILADIQIEVSVRCWKLVSEAQADGWE